MHEGARRGFKWAVLIGLGATVMEVIYCFIAFTGLATFFTRGYVKAGMELFSFVFMLFLGMKFLLAKSVLAPAHLSDRADRLEERIEEKLHPHSAFMTGLVRVMGNLGVLVFWIILAANFISREWVTPDWPGKLSLRGRGGGGDGGLVPGAELAGLTGPWQVQRKDAAAHGAHLWDMPPRAGPDSRRDDRAADGEAQTCDPRLRWWAGGGNQT